MTKYVIVAVLCLAVSIVGYPNHPRSQLSTDTTPMPIVTREAWGGNPPVYVNPLNTPVPYVVIHHSVVPTICMTKEQCMSDMQFIQRAHQINNGWADIGYNFAVGGEGSAYEGRGWEAVGAHTVGLNIQSIGIVLIGNFVSELPPAAALETAKQLISEGVRLGYIKADYKLVGHNQAALTQCPGDALYHEIQSWDNFSSTL